MEQIVVECVTYNIKIWKDKNAKLIKDKTTDASCGLIVDDTTLFIVFKYTDSKIDWKYNFKFYPTKIAPLFSKSKVRIHNGHLLQYKSLESQYKECMNQLLENNKNITDIVFTGFSLGGSLCKIAAWDNLKTIKDKKMHCYCFGSANVGNKSFVKEFNKLDCVQRIVYGNDPVPILPPRLFGYARTKNPLHIVKKGSKYEFKEEDRSLWLNLKILKSIIYSKVRNDQNIKYFDDHSLQKIKNSVPYLYMND